jgi:hypothetical protein
MKKQISPVVGLLLKFRPIQAFVDMANRERLAGQEGVLNEIFGDGSAHDVVAMSRPEKIPDH